MRPAKRLLIFCPNTSILSMTAYVLRQYRYIVRTADSTQEAAELMRDDQFDGGIVIYVALPDSCEEVVKGMSGLMSTMLVVRADDYPDGMTQAHITLSRGNDNTTLIPAVKLLVRRKRGPKPVKERSRKAYESRERMEWERVERMLKLAARRQ